MMKQNREQRRKDAKAKARLNRELQIHSQMAFDAALIAASDVFHCGPSRCIAFAEAYQETFEEILKDFADDGEFIFLRGEHLLSANFGEDVAVKPVKSDHDAFVACADESAHCVFCFFLF